MHQRWDAMPNSPRRKSKKSRSPAPVPARKKRSLRQPEVVMGRILEAATLAFTRDGFKGARLRSIATDAGITIQLLIYHTKNKTHLWHKTMEYILNRYTEISSKTKALPKSVSAGERLRHMIADIVHYTSSTPEIHRIMTQEGSQLSPRLVWMIENFSRAWHLEFAQLAELAQREGAIRGDIDVGRLRFAVTGMAAVPFSVAAEYEYLTGRDPFSRGEVAKTIELIEHMLFVKH
jgi:TetR/AcrR family transcriptional regulator